ncbi:MAG TPA: DUF2065 domain-containing protein [Rhodobacteraceae bacterium]|nr:DUF2065 domain-containing protein [Paracoccaceae bacterium]
MQTVLLGIGLVLAIEGLVYALAPSLVEGLLEALKSLPVEKRRQIGLISLALGVGLIWVSRHL